MSKGPWLVRKAAVRRMIEGVESAGKEIDRVEFVDGKVIVFPKKDGETVSRVSGNQTEDLGDLV
jgi:hypothetical protein